MVLTEKKQKQHYHLEKLININMVQVKKYYPHFKEEWYNKLSLHIHLSVKYLKNK